MGMLRPDPASGNLRRTKSAARRAQPRALRIEPCEERRLLAVGPQLISVGPGDGTLLSEGRTLRESPRELRFTFDAGQVINPATLGGIQLVRSGFDGVVGNDDDVTLTPGFAGIGDQPHEVIVRFADVLPDDQYRLTIFGTAGRALTNSLGEPFNNGVDRSINFDVDLGPQVVAVVPQPLSRTSGETVLPIANPAPGAGQFGARLAAAGSLLAVSDPLDDTAGTDAGAVYLLDAAGQVSRKLVNPLTNGGGLFGAALAADASRVVAGAPFESSSGTPGAGAVHVFGTGGLLVDSFTSPAPHAGQNFGSAVAINGNKLIVGAPHLDAPGFDKTGAVYVFDLTGGAPLTINNPEQGVTARFGTAVASAGGQILIGAIGGGGGGRAYLFNLDGTLVRTFNNPGGGQNDEFGSSVAFLGANLLVGAPLTNAGSFNSGAAYLFQPGGQLLKTFEAPVPQVSQHFGRSVAAAGNDALIGAPLKNLTGAGSAGAAYLFSPDGALKRVYENPNPAAGSNFATAVAAIGNDLAFGVPQSAAGGSAVRIQRSAAGTVLNQAAHQIEVYFNHDDLDPDAAANPNVYRLFATQGSVTPSDDAGFTPTSAVYDATDRKVTLTFAQAIAQLGGAGVYRLRIGDNLGANAGNRPAVVFNVDITDTFAGAAGQSSFLTDAVTSAVISSTIRSTGGILPIPGGNNEPGHRDIPFESHVGGPDTSAGTSTIAYSFPTVYGNGLPNLITPAQKQRTREVVEYYARYLGVQAFETPVGGIAVVTGDVRAVDPSLRPDAAGGISGGGIVVMNALIDWGESEPGGGWFEVAMHEIGHELGLGHTYDLPALTVMGSEGEVVRGPVEPVLPGNHDIVHGQHIRQPASNDVDLYRFELTQPGLWRAEVQAERLPAASLLDSLLTLYRDVNGTFELIARNDDYFGKDSYLELSLQPGNYFLAISSTGNDQFDPTLSNSGYGGRTDGEYQLELKFTPLAQTQLVDMTGTPLDGDQDGRPGGVFNFWFRAGETLFVDKAAEGTSGPVGSLTNPYREIDQALAAAQPGQIVRIVGNGGADGRLDTPADNRAYELGRDATLNPLVDGADLQVPRDVTVMVDAGAILKLLTTHVDVGTSSPSIDRSGGAFQVLGTPAARVLMTSFNDDTAGQDSDNQPRVALPGDWGGIIFRSDADDEAEGIFQNVVNQAELRFGGGNVPVESIERPVATIDLTGARPALTNLTIRRAANAAISADPDSFEESHFDQLFSFVDYERIGFHARGVQLVDNSLNGAFVRVVTPSVSALINKVAVPARFDDTELVHIIGENLIIQGNPGGPLSVGGTLRGRPSGRLAIDPGVVVKLGGSRIEAEVGAQLIAEGLPGHEVIFTSISDDRFGAGGSFDTNRDGDDSEPAPGDWAGLMFRPMSRGNLEHALLTFGGGASSIEGELDRFNVLEISQADVRVAHTTIRDNLDGFSYSQVGPTSTSDRGGRGGNVPSTVFIRGAQPTFIANVIRDNAGPAFSIDVNALNFRANPDLGRTTGFGDRLIGYGDNVGPLFRDNRLGNNRTNALVIRGATLTTQGVWDDTDIVHVLFNEVASPDHHTYSGLRLQSRPGESLVVKLESLNSQVLAGISAIGRPLDITDRIGGSVQIVGLPGAPVVLTALSDSSVGAGLTPDGRPQVNTGNVAGVGGLPTGPEVDRGRLIDNDVAPGIVGQFAINVDPGGEASGSGLTAQGRTELFVNEDFIFDYLNFIDTGANGDAFSLATTTITQAPTLIAPDTVVSRGTFAGPNGVVAWEVISRMMNGETRFENTLRLTSAQPLGTIRFINYLDEDIRDFTNDLLYPVGTPGEADFRLFTLDDEERVGFSQGGVYVPGTQLVNATYLGWAADEYADLLTDITESGTSYAVAGNIDQSSLPPFSDPDLGIVYGLEDVTTAMAWAVNPSATSATITTFLDAVAEDPALGSPGAWRGVRFERFSNDRNVALALEEEPGFGSDTELNNTPARAQFLGELAARELASDDNRRLGFEIHGAIREGSPGDVDVYSFRGVAGTPVWFDVDRTAMNLDLLLEVIDATGTVLVRSTDEPGGDLYSNNPRDPFLGGYVLPGTPGALANYLVRVRSQGADLNQLTGGQTDGTYQLQVRLSPVDEVPGSTVRLADIRYATNAVELIGMPQHSPLLGESASKIVGGLPVNNSLETAFDLGNLLQSDRSMFSVAGNIPAASLAADTENWFKFTVDVTAIQRIAGSSDGELTWATIFDLDLADGVLRADMMLSVFDSAGRLIYIGTDSNIAEDRVTIGNSSQETDLGRGSFGSRDPYIGSTQLRTGQTYYVAISHAGRLPSQLDQYYRATPVESLLRLEPVTGVRRVIEDHIGFTGFTSGRPQDFSTAHVPAGGLLPIATVAELSPLVVPFRLEDLTLYTSNLGTVAEGNVAAGNDTRSLNIASLAASDAQIRDLTMRSDGRLFAYLALGNDMANAGRLVEVGWDSGDITTIGNDGIADDVLITDNVDALAFLAAGRVPDPDEPADQQQYDLFYSVRGAGVSVLFAANFRDGSADGDPPLGLVAAINTPGTVTGLAGIDGDGNGLDEQLWGVTNQGAMVLINQNTAQVLHTSTLPGVKFAGATAGPKNLEGGAYARYVFAITDGGELYAYDTVARQFATTFFQGAPSIKVAGSSTTGLAFSPLDFNLWHPTLRRSGDDGHGLGFAPDASRVAQPDDDINLLDVSGFPPEEQDQLQRQQKEWEGGASFYFGFEDALGETLRYQPSAGQFGVVSEATQLRLAGNPLIGNNYNLPGGAKGTLRTNPFSLAGSVADDKPVLYFNYYLETQNALSDLAQAQMKDSARVFISSNGGATWDLVATNNSIRKNLSQSELPDHWSLSARPGDAFDGAYDDRQQVQELFDDTAGNGQWRQARVDLTDYAGRPNLLLRFDFSTSGTMRRPGQDFSSLPGDAYGNPRSIERGRANDFEGFYVDDIIVGYAERGEMVSTGRTITPGGEATFVAAPTPLEPVDTSRLKPITNGEFQLEIRRGIETGEVAAKPRTGILITGQQDTNSSPLGEGGRSVDRNVPRDAGQIVIESSQFSFASQAAIRVDAGQRGPGSNENPSPGAPRVFRELNPEGLAPGVTIRNNLIKNVVTTGIVFSGEARDPDQPDGAVPFGRIVNNTIFGGETAQGVGLDIGNFASPTAVNNIFAGLQTGVVTQGANLGSTAVLAANVYHRNTTNRGLGLIETFGLDLAAATSLFVDPGEGNFSLVANSRAIDASLNSLQDRTSLFEVQDSINMPRSAILAPDRDLFGRLRADDPSVAPFPGLGSNVFKDRGAVESLDPSRIGTLVISNASILEGDAGLRDLVFTVLLTAPSTQPVRVSYQTAPGTALAGSDFLPATGTLIFNPGQTSRTISVSIVGDTVGELDETFLVNLLAPENAQIAVSQATGTILNDDEVLPTLAIDNVQMEEGQSGQTSFVFTVSLLAAATSEIRVDFATSDGTARVPSDYQSAQGTLIFAPGQLSRTITINVNGDRVIEPNETFFVNLSNSVGALIVTSQGVGTIVNDDEPGNNGGPVGNEFQVNTSVAGNQRQPATAMNAAGAAVVVWTSFNASGEGDIFAQAYTPTGTKLGFEVRVNGFITGDQQQPDVAADALGNFVVVWAGRGAGDDQGIFAQRFSALGAAQGGPILVNNFVAGRQSQPAVAMAPNGSFVVTWTSDEQGLVFAQRFDSQGIALGAKVQASTGALQSNPAPNVAMDAGGNFLVVWGGVRGDRQQVFGQPFRFDGVPFGSAFLVNELTAIDPQGTPDVAGRGFGEFVITWASNAPSGVAEVFARRYRNFSPLSGVFQVNQTTTGAQNEPAVAMDQAGNFLVTWTSTGQDGSGRGVYGRVYNSAGSVVSGTSDLRINSTTLGDQFEPAAAMAPTGGRMLVVWTGQDSAGQGVFGQRLEFVVSSPEDALALSLPSSLAVGEGQTAGFQPNSPGTIPSTVRYTLGVDAPQGATIDPVSGNFQWQPADNLAQPVPITVIATDSAQGNLATYRTLSIRVDNLPPTAQLTVPATRRAQTPLTFQLAASDPGSVDQGGTFRYDIDWNGDGTFDQTVNGPAQMQVTRTYTQPGNYTIRVRASDKDGATGPVAAAAAEVLPEQLAPPVPLGTLATHNRQAPEVGATLSEYSFTPSRTGLFTARLLYGATGAEAQVVLTQNGTEVGRGVAATGGLRLDAPVVAGQSYLLRVSYFDSSGATQQAGLELWNLVAQSGATVTVGGTDANDTFDVTISASQFDVRLNGLAYQFPRAQVTTLAIAGTGDGDRLNLTGSTQNERAQLQPRTGQLTGSGYTVSHSGIRSLNLAGGGGFDQAELADSADGDTLVARPGDTQFTGASFDQRLTGFASARATAASGLDQAHLYDSTGDDQLTARPAFSQLAGGNFLSYASGFDSVRVYASGGNDSALLYDSAGDDQLTMRPTYSQLVGTGYSSFARGFDQVRAYASTGNDAAAIYDTAGDDQLLARPDQAQLTGAGYLAFAKGFDQVRAYGSTGFDAAVLYDSAGADQFLARSDYSQLSGQDYLSYAKGFDEVRAFSSTGSDVAELFDTAGNDQALVRPDFAQIVGAGYFALACEFPTVRVYGSTGVDGALIFGDGTNEAARIDNGVVALTGANRSQSVSQFDQVRVYGGGGQNTAELIDQALAVELEQGQDSLRLSDSELAVWLYNFRRLTSPQPVEAQLTPSGGKLTARDFLFGAGGNWTGL